jgi:uncharacterized protein
MAEEVKLVKPWMVAVWPGIGQVAISAGYYLMSKLGMHALAEFSPRELFDVDHVEVKDGLIATGRLPRSRLFLWKDPQGQRDIVVFIGEAQPPLGKYAFCHKLLELAQQLGVERLFTFAAMATQMHPQHASRVFAAATKEERLSELRQFDLEVLKEGHISGLNGIVLGVAAEAGMCGICLLGEMPHIFAQLPFPRASLAVLQVFTKMAGIDIDLAELSQQAREVGEKLGEILASVERSITQERGDEEPEFETAYGSEQPEEPRVAPADEQHLEELFGQAKEDRSKAYVLKNELDRLGVFKDYEDRFLDLFKIQE